MKHLLFCFVAALLVLSIQPGAAQYVSSTPEDIPINGAFPRYYPNENTRSVFDVALINNDGWLDLATGQNLEHGTIKNFYSYTSHNGDWRNNTQSSPTFQYPLNNFLSYTTSYQTDYIRDVAFGQLRVGQNKDLALARDGANPKVQIYRNQGGVIESNVLQTINGAAISLS